MLKRATRVRVDRKIFPHKLLHRDHLDNSFMDRDRLLIRERACECEDFLQTDRQLS